MFVKLKHALSSIKMYLQDRSNVNVPADTQLRYVFRIGARPEPAIPVDHPAIDSGIVKYDSRLAYDGLDSASVSSGIIKYGTGLAYDGFNTASMESAIISFAYELV